MKTMTRSLLLLIAALLLPAAAFANANIVIVNNDPPGIGFNDPSPATPIGGNMGTTKGQQRLNAFTYAAQIWGSTIDSSVTIRIRANFGPLSCTATAATLGSAGARGIWANFDNAREIDTWYHVALANKQAGYDLAPVGNTTGDDEVDIAASFNSQIGTTGCLQTSLGWYYGLDANQPANSINLVTVLLHEFAHGLGFSNFVSRTTGQNAGYPVFPWPDVYEKHMFDRTQNMYWDMLSASQRLTSRVNTNNLAWSSPLVNSFTSTVLSKTPQLVVTGAVNNTFALGSAEFGPALSYPGVSGTLVAALDAADAAGPSNTDGCSAITSDVAGKVAFMNRGTCGFAVKVLNAQNAGAIAVVIGDNAASATPADMAASGVPAVDNAITIPSGRLTLADANTVRPFLGSLNVAVGTHPSQLRGADADGHILLYAPNPFVSGSSTSHWDVTATRNQLMEPNINANLTHNVTPPYDLTLPMLRDLGWYADADNDLVEDSADNCPAIANANQADNDHDGQGDVCDNDDDNDGVLDVNDNCPLTANADQANYDGDAQGDTCDTDDDNDGVLDVNDDTQFSDLRPTVVIGSCDTGVTNTLFPNGSTLADRIAKIKASAANHGDFVSGVNALLNELKAQGLITGAQKAAIGSCAAQN
ncbi:MAG TPA: thrombospondin type 3 repeat-containing protein [Thermoanaerobaculia bacterium]|nr:thrombospondin type 3 repeat-containing protein [Thermoanaerobaculia bacterium]